MSTASFIPTGNEHHERNRVSWNAATVAHNSHKVDQHVFFHDKGSTLFQEEQDLLGDLAGLSVCHLQCNAGQDTLSLATRLGAKNPVGVDISDTAIEFATHLAKDSGIEATFIRADVFDYFDAAEPNQFDVVFASYGTLCWLSSVKTYAAGVRRILKPGGRYCLVDFHPTACIFNADMVHDNPYSTAGEPIHEQVGVHDYVAQSTTGDGEILPTLKYAEGIKDFENPNPTTEFYWGLADVIGAFVETGLQLTHFKEYPYSNFFKIYKTKMTPEQVEAGIRWHYAGPMLPFMYSISVKK
ncbi:S-adenosyl-L-methionine-dependent methyltransferase [Powellomyces hirtus]|nr:S-adenosyl-L-methionine-dependent methyltransferase [Powellomyces hirtus]